ncbi:MAG: phosphatase PAP2 family protein [Nitrospirales bacterium]
MMISDELWFAYINGWAGQFTGLDWFMLQVSREGNLLIPGILVVAYWGWMKWGEARFAIPCLGLLIGFSDFLGGQLKTLIGRPRPCQVLDHIHELVGCGGAFSMPSNHALNSGTAISFLVMLYPPLGWVLWPFLALIGLSRVFLGAHYVTDVLVGVGLGALLGGGVGFLLKTRVFRRKPVAG